MEYGLLQLVAFLLLFAILIVALEAVGRVLGDVFDEILDFAAAAVRNRRLGIFRQPEEGREPAKDGF